MVRTLLTLALVVLFTTSQAQDKGYRSNKYKWPDEHPAQQEVKPEFSKEDAVILSEKTDMEILNDNLYGSSYKLVLNKTMRIKFLTQKGIDKFSRFSLPESYDPFSDNYKRPQDSLQHGYQPKGQIDLVNYFTARIIHSDGVVEPANVTDSSEVELYYLNGYERNRMYLGYLNNISSEKKAYATHFKVTNLKPGDELEVAYSVKNIYMSNRMFFHGALAKQSCEVVFKYNSNLDLFFVTQFNNAMYIDSTNDHKTALYRWQYNNLPSCLDEKGARPYKDLPCICFYRHFKNYGDVDPKTNEIKVYKPYTWEIVMATDASFRDINFERGTNNMLDRSTIAFNKFFSETTADIPDSLPWKKILAAHDTLVESFEFQADDDYYKGIDTRNKRFGEFMENRKIREINRSEVYSRVFVRVGAPYSNVWLLDKRIEEMNYNKFGLASTAVNGYCVETGKKKFYFQPKHHRYGYYANEFPFYLEDIPIMHVPQWVQNDDGKADYDWRSVNLKATKTPFSTVADNSRTTNIKAEINSSSPQIKFEARVSLKGQYSTLTRGYYQYEYKDFSVNPKYYIKVWDINPGSSVKYSITTHSNQFPFEFAFNCSFQSDKLMTTANDVKQISLKGWFPHVTESDNSVNERVLPYYTDFAGSDTYRYYIKSDKPVQILNAADYEKNIDTEYFSYVCKITQPQPDVIMIESMLVEKQEKIPPQLVRGFMEACKAAQKINEGKLEVKFL